MILKGSQRSNAAQLARHLQNARDNEHIELHELRGFLAEDLEGALQEAECISRGTRCRQFLFSLSLNPPQEAEVPTENFEAAIDMIEQKLGLDDQPRAVIFHEKEGRRHAHVVWSRIDAETMTARNLPYFKNRLMEVSKDLYLEHGWDLPKGLVDHHARNPLNFSRDEWQQAWRAKMDPRLIKAVFRESWARSDSRQAFQSALEERGYFLARGDRRGFVAVDFQGEVYAVAKWTGLKAKEVKARLGDEKELPSVADTKEMIADRMNEKLRTFLKEAQKKHQRLAPSIELKRKQMVERHRNERALLDQQQSTRWTEETNARAARLPGGFGGIWSRITGRYGKIRRQNEYEAWESYRRDQAEKDALIARQLEERRTLQQQIQQVRNAQTEELQHLHQDMARYMAMADRDPPEIQEHFRDAAEDGIEEPTHDRDPGRDDGFGPEL